MNKNVIKQNLLSITCCAVYDFITCRHKNKDQLKYQVLLFFLYWKIFLEAFRFSPKCPLANNWTDAMNLRANILILKDRNAEVLLFLFSKRNYYSCVEHVVKIFRKKLTMLWTPSMIFKHKHWNEQKLYYLE